MPVKNGKKKIFRVSAVMKEPKTELGKFLRTKRLSRKMTQIEVANKAKTNVCIISEIELGKYPPSIEMINRICKALKCVVPDKIVSQLKLDPPEYMPFIMVERKNELGQFLTEKRLELGLRQKEVASLAGVSYMVVSGTETGNYRPAPKTLKKIADALRCEIPEDIF